MKITDLLNEDVISVIGEESLVAIQEAFEKKVDLTTEAALIAQDEVYAEKLKPDEAVKKLTSLLDASSPLTTQSTNLTTKISKYKAELDKLELRMTEMLARSKKQVAAMESMVGETKTLQTSLKSTFEGMMASYTNK